MAEPKSAANENEISRDRLAELLNEDLSREYQAIIAYVVYSQVLSGARLSRQNAGRHSQTGTHIEKCERYASV